jgi:hypothetical protein
MRQYVGAKTCPLALQATVKRRQGMERGAPVSGGRTILLGKPDSAPFSPRRLPSGTTVYGPALRNKFGSLMLA